jgi:hypothetical protein
VDQRRFAEEMTDYAYYKALYKMHKECAFFLFIFPIDSGSKI